MTRDELKAAAIDVLGKAFKEGKVEPHIVQAAIAVIFTPEPR